MTHGELLRKLPRKMVRGSQELTQVKKRGRLSLVEKVGTGCSLDRQHMLENKTGTGGGPHCVKWFCATALEEKIR